MQYRQLLQLINENVDPTYREFQKRLLKNDSINLLGVRIPVLRKIAKQFKDDIDNLLSFPNENYETVFIKLTAVSKLDYDGLIKYIDYCVSLIDNWATCDCFAPKCISKNKNQFLQYIEKYINCDSEFCQRFALTTLLHFYVEDEYLQTIFNVIEKAKTEKYYYVHMAASWLIAEVLIKFFDSGVLFLRSGAVDAKTNNKSIQKANESFRLSKEQKNFLKEIQR